MKKTTTSLLVSSAAVAAVSLLTSGLLYAAEIEAEFRTTYMRSDNVTRDDLDPIEEDIWTIGATFEFSENTLRSNTDIQAVFDYLDYQDDTFDSEVVGALNALFELTMVEEKLIWIIQENFGQRVFDPLATPNAGNRENINFFTTGPDVRLPMGTRHFFGAEARYSTIRYEESPFDNDRIFALLQVGRRTSSDSNISLNISQEQVEFDNDGLSDDFDINEAFIRYEKLNTRNFINAEVGYTKLNYEVEDLDGYLLRLDWTRVSSDSHSFMFSAGGQFSSQGDIFRNSQTDGRDIGGTVDLEGDGTPFYNYYLVARYDLDTARTRIVAEVDWSQDDYEIDPSTDPLDQALDRDVLGGRFYIERDITRGFFVNLNIEARSREYKYIDRSDDDLTVGVSAGYRFTDTFTVFLSFLRDKRESNIDTQSFTENRSVIGMSYSPPWGR